MKPLAGIPIATSPSILVVDDDRRVVELLQIALTAHGFRVLTAADGDEAVKRALAERPDLVVLDVRLPRKSGLEVCDILRQDSDCSQVPIVMVSAVTDADARLQGFSRGADDYLAKPFSPKELIARIKRLLARAAHAEEARRRGQEAELELARAREEAKRSHFELRKEQRLRELALGLGRDLHRSLDIDTLAGQFLLAVQAQLGVGVAALLCPERSGGPLVPAAIRGDGFARTFGLEIGPESELAGLLSGLARPVRRQDLERFAELGDALPAIVAGGFTLLAPLRSPAGLEGVLFTDDRVDGGDLSQTELEVLSALCDAVAVALHNAQRCRAQVQSVLEALAAQIRAGESRDRFESEASELAQRAARAALLPPRERSLVAHGIALGAWAESDLGARVMAQAAAGDPTGWVSELGRLVRHAGQTDSEGADSPSDERRASALLRVSRRYVEARIRGMNVRQSLETATDVSGEELDSTMREALASAAREPRSLARRRGK